jgi:hypothetical protein
LSEAGGVLTFFASFFVSRQKMKWGLGQSPSLLNSSDNQHIFFAKAALQLAVTTCESQIK